MIALVKALLDMIFACLVALQSISAQDKVRHSNLDISGETDSTVPYTSDAILLEIMVGYDVDADEAVGMLLLVISDPDHHDEAITIPNLLKGGGEQE